MIESDKLILLTLEWIQQMIPVTVTLLLGVVLLVLLARRFKAKMRHEHGARFRQQMILLLVGLLNLIAVLISLPISNELRGQLFSLLGLLVSAVIALSSTTIVGNIMAGIMLKAVGSFRIGDFIRVADYFGRVTESGLMHIEIQTEERQLVTLPNAFLVAQAVSVIRSSGTIISCDVSLGYDVSHKKIEACLIDAAKEAGLVEPTVYILLLGDFSVNYRIAGLLEDVKFLLSARSRLRTKVLDSLHKEDIEIASPNLMNTRAFESDHRYVPASSRAEDVDEVIAVSTLESMAFDKAERAEGLERLKLRFQRNEDNIQELDELLGEMDDEAAEKSETERRKHLLERQNEKLSRILAPTEEEVDSEQK